MRTERQRKIIELIQKSAIATQAALQTALKRVGFEVNQATLSRDIRELGLVKVESGGAYRYVSRQTAPRPMLHAKSQATPATLNGFIQEISHSGNIVVLKTDSGAASYVAEAIDGLSLPEVLGSIAGDNTIFLCLKADSKSQQLARKLQELTRQ